MLLITLILLINVINVNIKSFYFLFSYVLIIISRISLKKGVNIQKLYFINKSYEIKTQRYEKNILNWPIQNFSKNLRN